MNEINEGIMAKIFFIFIAFNLTLYAADSEIGTSIYRLRTNIKEPLELRDPFKKMLSKKKSQDKSILNEDGHYTNIKGKIEDKTIESLKIIGVITGKERRAMASIIGDKNNSEVFFLKEGMTVGVNKAEVKAILPGGVVFVEKIRNVYDQDEYLETIIPITSE